MRAFEGIARIAPRFYAHTVADYVVAVTVTTASTVVLGFIHPCSRRC